MHQIDELWDPKFDIQFHDPVVTFGSCFAQHIGRALQSRGFNWLITEKKPQWLREEDRIKFGFDIFSSRTGNIYTPSLLKQWLDWALGGDVPEDEIWEKEGRVYDPFRPAVEPNGFASADEMLRSRRVTIEAFRSCLTQAKYFVFTLGLTESWFNTETGYEYPMCPGTVAGEFNDRQHLFKNQGYDRIYNDLRDVSSRAREVNPQIRFILTVSPVPLTATNSGKHVVVATMHSKSVLRSVAGALAQELDYFDYFPSYEIINSPVFKGSFFAPDQRNVTPDGVGFVMDHLFKDLGRKYESKPREFTPNSVVSSAAHNAEACEEAMLAAFAP